MTPHRSLTVEHQALNDIIISSQHIKPVAPLFLMSTTDILSINIVVSSEPFWHGTGTLWYL